MRFNERGVRKDSRQIGVILAATGLLSAVLEQVNPWAGICVGLVGFVVVSVGNLEREND